MTTREAQEHEPSRRQLPTAGVLTIGQSPRSDDLVAEILSIAGGRLQLLERGALDGLDREQVAGLGPRPSGELLVTKLADGTPVQLDRDLILARLQEQITNLEDRGVSATLLLCTGSFPPFRHRRPLLVPSPALRGAVLGLAGGGRVASMVPLPAQAAQACRWWEEQGARNPVAVAAYPYGPDPMEEVDRAAGEAASCRGERPTVLFLDCFGYTLAMRARARVRFPGLVVLARSLAARFLVEVAGA
jgi:protein AroM